MLSHTACDFAKASNSLENTNADDTKIYHTVNYLEAIDSLRADLHNMVS